MNSIDQKFIEEKAISFTNWFKGHLSLGREKIEERNFPMIQNMMEFYLTISYGEGFKKGFQDAILSKEET